MKKVLMFFVVLVFASFAISCEKSDESVVVKENLATSTGDQSKGLLKATSASWNSMTSAQKTREIWTYANAVPEGADGGECWDWVCGVVSRASGGSANLANKWSGDYSLKINPKTDPSFARLNESISSDNVHAGMIVQMHITYVHGGDGPHTAIIGKKDKVNKIITWYESNWFNKNHKVVKTKHTDTFEAFEKRTVGGNSYAIYYFK